MKACSPKPSPFAATTATWAKPTMPGRSGGGPWPGVVLIHHMPGWDEWIKEATRKLAHHGFATISPHLYFREGPGSPDDVGARTRAAGGVLTSRSWATSQDAWSSCAPSPTPTARSV